MSQNLFIGLPLALPVYNGRQVGGNAAEQKEDKEEASCFIIKIETDK